MKTPATDHEQVGLGRSCDECGNWIVWELLASMVDEQVDLRSIDRLAALSDNRPKLAIKPFCDLPCCRVGSRRLG